MGHLAVSLSAAILDFFRTSDLSPSAFEELCVFLGFKKDSSRDSDESLQGRLLSFYEHCLATLHDPCKFYQLSNFFNNYENMDLPLLIDLCGAHGLSTSGSKQGLQDVLFQHICSGQCKETGILDSEAPPSCQNVMNELPMSDTPDLATCILAAIVHKMKEKALCRVVQMYNIESGSGDSLSKLHWTVKHFIGMSVKGKRFLQSSTCKRSHNSNEEELCDIQNRWPEVLSESLMDDLVNDFKEKTSSTQLAASVCASCAEMTLKVRSQTLPITDIDLMVLR